MINNCIPRVIAHRGFSALYPENTHAAFAAAIEAKADGIELDVQMTRDGVPVIFHDESLESVGMSGIRIVDLDFGALPDEIPSLGEVLRRFGQQTQWLLEIKWYQEPRDHVRALMDQVLSIVDGLRETKRSFILCFDLDLLRYGYEQNQCFRYVWNQNVGRYVDEPFLIAYSVRHQGMTADFVRSVHTSGKSVFTFTCNEKTEITRAAGCGVDGIMSDDVAFLKQTFRPAFQYATQPAL